MEIYYFKIGGGVQKIVSDLKIPIFESGVFSRFKSKRGKPSSTFSFSFLDQKPQRYSLLTIQEKELLKKSIGFPIFWLSSMAFCFPQVHYIIRNCLRFPELLFVDLRWSRILIQNFKKNNFFVFFSPDKKSILSQKTFFAGFRNTIWGSFPKYSSMLMHGASAIIEKKAALFIASDAGGKTTTISQFQPNKILNDDQIVIRKSKSGIRIYSTPFGTISCGNKSAPLGAIYLIHKSHSFRITKANPLKILEFIWNEHAINSIVLPKIMRIDLFNLLYDVVKQIPVYNLYLKKGEIDFQAISQSL